VGITIQALSVSLSLRGAGITQQALSVSLSLRGAGIRTYNDGCQPPPGGGWQSYKSGATIPKKPAHFPKKYLTNTPKSVKECEENQSLTRILS